ncbi:glutathione peroxidase [Arcobacter sp. CECT 8985]|uniref:glutathione peroxidase n=1 Tax=Arcobacter sp. CECT 8985 TaxID=1935424 RepID=UPI00100ABDBE|nr:glutathione peroxidase [Arcobacter sp. CECT 8985]
MEIYNFSAKSLSGEEINFDKYKGKIILIVNTASKCGFTYQYKGLEELYRKYKDKGLVILGFPCNQFGNQEPGNENSIKEGCLINYGVSFQMFSKVDVNGSSAHPLFNYLKSCMSGILGSRIKWNFTKFLIDQNGVVIKRFGSIDSAKKIEFFLKQIIS